MHSCTVILAIRVRRRLHEANIVVVPCKWTQHCCATLGRSQNNRTVGTCCGKILTGFKLYATSANKCQQVPTSANKCQHCCGPMHTDATCWAQQCCVRLHGPLAFYGYYRKPVPISHVIFPRFTCSLISTGK